MALENATFPNQLVATNPTLADPKGQGDDHLRMIKRVIQATFPLLTGAVNLTQDQLNVLGTPNLFVTPGMIVMWSGALTSLPAGWLLCNGVGTITGGLSVPDLRDKFIAGAGASFAVRDVGGTSTHTHSASTAITPTVLDISQIPAHTHQITQVFDNIGFLANTAGHGGPGAPSPGPVTSSTGSGAAHGHGASTSVVAASNLPPFMALGFIIKS